MTTRQAKRRRYIERFHEIAQKGFGSDSAYADCYVGMLDFAERGYLPVAYADWYGEPPNYLAHDGKRELPFPPLPP